MNAPVWRIDTVVNPFNDSIQMLAEPEEKGEEVSHPFILPEDITFEDRKDYPMRIMRNTLEDQFLDEINHRVLPHIPHNLIEMVVILMLKVELHCC